MKKQSLIMATCVALALVLGLAGGVMAAPPAPSPCNTNGGMDSTTPVPASYTYTQGIDNSTTATFKVSSPGVNKSGGCIGPPYVFGNSSSGTLNVTILITDIIPANADTPALSDSLKTSFKNSFEFNPGTFQLVPPGNSPGDSDKSVQLKFTNNSAIPVGEYDVKIQARGDITGVGPGNTTFTVEVTAPVAVDTLAPTVGITSPASGSRLLLNAPLHVEFIAVDPSEGGAGTGITAVQAYIESCGGVWQQDISSNLAISPALPQDAGVTVTATEDLSAAWIGSFSLNANAKDNADHTGSASNSFTVGVDVAALPPIAVPGRQFKAGSTVPIKWQVTGYGGAFLPPFTDIKAAIQMGTEPVYRVAGDGADSIRWELDASGNATQYITNYQIPSDGIGTYTVTIYLNDVCGNYVGQGNRFTFVASTKGGK
jgi:hypothetical protein